MAHTRRKRGGNSESPASRPARGGPNGRSGTHQKDEPAERRGHREVQDVVRTAAVVGDRRGRPEERAAVVTGSLRRGAQAARSAFTRTMAEADGTARGQEGVDPGRDTSARRTARAKQAARCRRRGSGPTGQSRAHAWGREGFVGHTPLIGRPRSFFRRWTPARARASRARTDRARARHRRRPSSAPGR